MKNARSKARPRLVLTTLAGLLMAPSLSGAPVAKIVDLAFSGNSDPNEITIKANAPLTYEKQENTADNQVIIEIKDAQIPKNLTRKLDTSSFKSKVTLISPYQLKDSNTVRVVIQLREPGTADVTADGNTLKVAIAPPDGAAVDAVPGNDNSEAADRTDTPASAAEAADSSAAESPSRAGAQPRSRLDEFATAGATGKFTGKPITLNVRDADVSDVMRLIGEASGFNIVMTSDVQGKLTLSLNEVPWDQALQVVLQLMHLGAERNNNVLRITTLQNLTKEKQEQLAATLASQAAAPKVTRQFPISYAKLTDLEKILKEFAKAPKSATDSQESIVVLDDRTNSILVRDTAENIEKMRKLVELLDTQTPQVLIEAKIVEASEGFSKFISGNVGFANSTYVSPHFASFSGANPLDPLVGGTAPIFTGTGIGGASGGTAGQARSGAFGFSPDLSLFGSNVRINSFLNLGESENTAKIIASPKLVVINKSKANIVQGTPVLVPMMSIVNQTPVVSPGVQSANLSLDVTPTITNDGSVLMKLTMSRDVPQSLGSGGSGIATRKIDTEVLVESGSTLSIGGIYTSNSEETSEGFPFLRKIPIIGWLFGRETSINSKVELFIFITPRIINTKESGLTDSTTAPVTPETSLSSPPPPA